MSTFPKPYEQKITGTDRNEIIQFLEECRKSENMNWAEFKANKVQE